MTRKSLHPPTGLTLTELLVATTVTTLIVAALGGITKAVMDAVREASWNRDTAQAGRVIMARIAQTVSGSQQVLEIPNALESWPGWQPVLLVWERDGDPEDPAPGQPNLAELVIFALAERSDRSPGQLLEIRPNVDRQLLVPLDSPNALARWIERFIQGEDIEQSPVVLSDELGGIYFQLEESSEPQGIPGLMQQNVRISLYLLPSEGRPTFFFGSALRRYVVSS